MNISAREGTKVIEQTLVTLRCNERLSLQDARFLRGVFAGIYPNRPEFHGHGPSGLVYEHPRIQYKVVDGRGSIVGLQEGGFLLQVAEVPMRLRLRARWLDVMAVDRIVRTVPFGLTELSIEYKFGTPWLALNAENHGRFQVERLQGKEATNALMKKVLIGNLLSMSKSLDYEVPGLIEMTVEVEEPAEVVLKPGVALLGFLGRFRTNFLIPPLWGIGKQSARGFGTVLKIA